MPWCFHPQSVNPVVRHKLLDVSLAAWPGVYVCAPAGRKTLCCWQMLSYFTKTEKCWSQMATLPNSASPLRGQLLGVFTRLMFGSLHVTYNVVFSLWHPWLSFLPSQEKVKQRTTYQGFLWRSSPWWPQLMHISLKLMCWKKWTTLGYFSWSLQVICQKVAVYDVRIFTRCLACISSIRFIFVVLQQCLRRFRSLANKGPRAIPTSRVVTGTENPLGRPITYTTYWLVNTQWHPSSFWQTNMNDAASFLQSIFG